MTAAAPTPAPGRRRPPRAVGPEELPAPVLDDVSSPDCGWAEIGQLLGLSADAAARRYRPHQ